MGIVNKSQFIGEYMEQKYNGMDLSIPETNPKAQQWGQSRNDAIDEEINKTLLHVDETIRRYNERLAAQNIDAGRPPEADMQYAIDDAIKQSEKATEDSVTDCLMRHYKDEREARVAKIKASETATTGGRKFDGGKLQYGLIPPLAQKAMVEILTFGAEKYEPDNWKHVPDSKRRYFDAMMRHLWDWKEGEQNDPESGKNHLAHAMCCLAFLYEHDVKYSVK